MKSAGPTRVVQLELCSLSGFGAGGIRGVAVKCLDITKNSDSVGILPGPY